ncbi:DUF4276 family protein [candidate division KSB1 bacterium]|nr:DUF4276 family protein [candidate division KSB1 bacterium]
MRVIIYVEGPSDKAAMNALLRPLIEQKHQEGVTIDFFESPAGDKKASVLTKVPQKAVNIILNDPHAVVVAMPDLYPKDKVFKHETVVELTNGILKNFEEALAAKKTKSRAGIRDRFKVFCFKYELEALLLASQEALQNRLGVKALKPAWRIPVEDQDHDHPPKQIVEKLFSKYGKKYKETVDAPFILGMSNYQKIADLCPQCFKPFVKFLSGL